MVNIKEVAKLANTSITTVSRVINNTGYVKQETREKVEGAMKTLDYKPLERADAARRTKAIGLIVPDIENPFFGKMARHIGMVANTLNYNLFLFAIQGIERHREEFLTDMIEKRVDGLIYASSKGCKKVIQAAKKRKIPFVVLDRELQEAEINTVIVDNNYGAFIATEHLIQLGHKAIAFIGGAEDMETSAKRKEGYEKALLKYGLKINESYVRHGNYKMQSGYDCMRELYESHREISGVIAANDLMAIGALNFLNREGVKDISVVGFDNIELSEGIVPSLTTVEYPMERISETVIDLILQQIKDSDTNVQVVTLYPKLIIRESSTTTSENRKKG